MQHPSGVCLLSSHTLIDAEVETDEASVQAPVQCLCSRPTGTAFHSAADISLGNTEARLGNAVKITLQGWALVDVRTAAKISPCVGHDST